MTAIKLFLWTMCLTSGSECTYGDDRTGLFYMGKAATTIEGLPCLPWTQACLTAFRPRNRFIQTDTHRGNFCRNPRNQDHRDDYSPQTWCYTKCRVTSREKTYGYCSLKTCSKFLLVFRSWRLFKTFVMIFVCGVVVFSNSSLGPSTSSIVTWCAILLCWWCSWCSHWFSGCPDYWYGRNCEHECNCHMNEICDKSTGQCRVHFCARGYQGLNCTQGFWLNNFMKK